MNREDIIRMAREADFKANANEPYNVTNEWVFRFAALVASAEREACAKSLEEAAQAAKDADPQGFVWIAIKTSAEGIRARGKA
jgi:hypothetical protein